MTAGPTGVLGLFPAFHEVGGVQASGRTASECLAEWLDGPPGGERRGSPGFHLFTYGRGASGEGVAVDGRTVSAGSRLGALAAMLRRRWPVGLVLVWHLDLVRLLPFVRAPGARAVVMLHGIEAWRPLDGPTRRALRRAALLISNSDYTWRRFAEANPEGAATPHATVPLGIGAPLSDAAPRPGDPPAVAMLGRLRQAEGYKGHREMIAAWPIVLARCPRAELWIAGEGDLRPTLERQALGLGLEGRVRFLGLVSEAAKQELLARCRCLAMPSRGEGFGLVYLEAMRVGRPCLIGAADAGREVVAPPEAGLAVDPADPAALAEAVARLIGDGREWENWARCARARYEGNFTSRHYQARLVRALEGLL
jgi:phosphatidylinositol alpha-1,6-mannosyltransferase